LYSETTILRENEGKVRREKEVLQRNIVAGDGFSGEFWRRSEV